MCIDAVHLLGLTEGVRSAWQGQGHCGSVRLPSLWFAGILLEAFYTENDENQCEITERVIMTFDDTCLTI